MPAAHEIPFVKGHGTGNDFVLVPDEHGATRLTDTDVRFLCDRRFGIGGDGVLRVVRTEHVDDLDGAVRDDAMRRGADWFMDYRNADGSVAEMCGNGARVFVRYLVSSGLVEATTLAIGTRGGVVDARVEDSGEITLDMGHATTPKARALPSVSVESRSWPAVGVLVPNPHAVVFVDDLADAGELRTAPEVAPASVFPEGVNVEFVVDRGPGHVAMRVHERGVGETLSCGTGACAVAWAAARRDGEPSGERTTCVDVPGGTVHVTETTDGRLLLRGPAELIARGHVLLPA